MDKIKINILDECCWLIQRDMFNSILVSFLPVGHTKLSPDRFFGSVSHELHNHNGTALSDITTSRTSFKCNS